MQRLLAIVFIVLNGLCVTSWSRAEVIDIDIARLAELQKNGVPLVDIRTQAEWEDTGIVAGSHLLSFFDEKGNSDPAGWLAKLKPIADTGQAVIVICRSGNRTRLVGRFLSEQAGYKTVYNVKNGLKEWLANGKPVVPARDTIASCKAARAC